MRPSFLVFALALAVSPAIAAASPSYPGTIARELELPCEPDCTLCHTRPTGGFATVNTPFGLTVRMDHDLVCCDPALLAGVLDELRDDETDTDGDGASDIDELQALTSPSTEDDVDLACHAASGADDSGCAVGSPGAGEASSALVVAAVFVVVAAAVRRRRLA